jgi:hypothetical protein
MVFGAFGTVSELLGVTFDPLGAVSERSETIPEHAEMTSEPMGMIPEQRGSAPN